MTSTPTYANPDSTYTSAQISSWWNQAVDYDVTYSYTYDNRGNILSVVREAKNTNVKTTTSYTYDGLNQLTQENNQAAGKTWVYTYDAGGNILTKKEYAYTTGTVGTAVSTINYEYNDDRGWKDILTSYNGVTRTHDEIGNLLHDGTWTYTWEGGRRLKSMTKADGTAVTFAYDKNGLGLSKMVGETTQRYTYNGGNLVQIVDGEEYHYIRYDDKGQAITFSYGTASYYLVYNAQGDVVAIAKRDGTIVVEYTYDAWGKILSCTGSMAETLGRKNPFRYRGYVYDEETGLYYVSSRYYDPEIGRWISPEPNVYNGEFDEGAGLIGYNVYAYCANNPVNFSDPTGEFALGVILGKAAIGAAVNVLTTYIGAKVTGQSYSWKDAGVAALAGALGTGGTVLKVAAGVVSGLYTGVTAYQNGADLGKAVLAGAVSAWGTTVSVANIAGWTGPALELGVSTFTDVVFGTASNSIAAATYCASIETSTSNNTKQQVGTQCANNLKRTKLYCDKRLR